MDKNVELAKVVFAIAMIMKIKPKQLVKFSLDNEARQKYVRELLRETILQLAKQEK